MDHRLRILSFLFFSHLINFLKAPTDLEFLFSTVRLFHSFMQYGKKVQASNFIKKETLEQVFSCEF